HPQNPLVKVLGLGSGDLRGHGGIDKTLDALDLVLLGQHRDVILEWVRDPEALVPDVRDALVVVPVILLGKGLVEAVVEVLVMREDNVATNIVKLVWSCCQQQPPPKRTTI